MKRLLLLVLLIPTFASAKLGEGKDAAEGRWGKSVNQQEQAYTYDSAKYRIVQMYGDDGKCIVVLYYKKDGSLISKVEADRFDAVNVTTSGITWHETDSGAPGLKQWNSQDDTLAIVAGLVPLGEKNVYCRGYITADGFAYIQKHGFLDKKADTEKDAT
jgi:hypothetical protein